MTHNRVARKGNRHFCPSHGIAEILAVEEWFKINDAPVICDGDLTGSGARLIASASASFFTVNGRAAVRRKH